MTQDKFIQIQDLTESAVLEVLQSKKTKPEVKADIGMKYYKMVTSTDLQKLSAVVQVAGLYSPANREEIAKNIAPPMSRFISSDIEITRKADIKALADMLKTKDEIIIAKDIELEQAEKKIMAAENKTEDLKDELKIKEAPKLQELIKAEYNLKREL